MKKLITPLETVYPSMPAMRISAANRSLQNAKGSGNNKKGQGGDPGLVLSVLEIRPETAVAPKTFFLPQLNESPVARRPPSLAQ